MNEALGVLVWTSGSFKGGVTSVEAEGCQAGTGMRLFLRSNPLLVQKRAPLRAGSECAPAHTFHFHHQAQLSVSTPPPPSQLHVSCLVSHIPSCPPSSLSTPGQPCKVSLSPCPTLPDHLNSSMLASVNTAYLPGSLLTPGPLHGSSLCLEHFGFYPLALHISAQAASLSLWTPRSAFFQRCVFFLLRTCPKGSST